VSEGAWERPGRGQGEGWGGVRGDRRPGELDGVGGWGPCPSSVGCQRPTAHCSHPPPPQWKKKSRVLMGAIVVVTLESEVGRDVDSGAMPVGSLPEIRV